MSKNLLGNTVYLTNDEYETLIRAGTVTLGSGEVVTYSENDTYITPEENATTTSAGLMSALDKSKLDNLSTVATTGSYNDLLNKPTIPTDTNQKVKAGTVTFGNNDEVNIVAGSNVTVTGDATNKKITIAATDTTYESKSAASGGTAVSLVTTGEKYTWNNKGTYSKPSGGIPKTDLESTVQTSLGKADSALQSVPSTYRTASAQDTIDSGKENSSNKVTSWSSTTTDTNYPSEKLVKTALDGKAAKSTTLAGYGITDAKIASGVITLGSNTITPLTSHQDISGKADKASGLTGATKCKITYNSSGIVTAGADLAATDIPSLAASKITSGTFDAARIPSLNASKITEGTFADARIASASTWNGKYTKPSTGIPASDLASGVIPDISGKQDKLAATGSATKPIYVSAAGTVSAANTYAGGTAVTLNGTSKASTTASFYAPTSQLANSDSKVYLVGATSGTSLTTVKSNSEVYMESGYLHSLGLDGSILTLGSTNTEYLSLYGTSVLVNDKPVTTKESRQVTLSSTTWSNNQQTVSCEGMSATADAVISPAPSSMSDVISSKIYASTQGSGTITFTCDEVPTNNVVFNVMIMS